MKTNAGKGHILKQKQSIWFENIKAGKLWALSGSGSTSLARRVWIFTWKWQNTNLQSNRLSVYTTDCMCKSHIFFWHEVNQLCYHKVPEHFRNLMILKVKTKSALALSKSSLELVSSVAQSCPTLCDPMNRSTPGLPVHHKLPEFIQTHAHQVGDAIQPSHPLLSPSPPTPNPSQHQGLFRVNCSHEVAKVLEFQLQHQSLQWTPELLLSKLAIEFKAEVCLWVY